MFMDKQLYKFKKLIQEAILEDGARGKESVIRSSSLINLIHDGVKQEFIEAGVCPDNIYPHLYETKPELKIAGFLKQKDQDICIVPSNIEPIPTLISWGPLAFLRKVDLYGEEYSENTLIVNVRSQMSSLAKNADTLFERTFAEAQNLHMRYSNIVLGEVYLIPTHEYDDQLVKQKVVGFKKKQTDLEKYISFFSGINRREIGGPDYSYERCALLIVDFDKEQPLLFSNSNQLKEAGLISEDFNIEYEELNFQNFVKEILEIYSECYQIQNLLV